MSQPQQKARPQRDPPPTLFLHPSPAASHVSLSSTAGPGPTVPSSSTSHQTQARVPSSTQQDPLAAALSSLSKPMDSLNSTRRPAVAAGARLNLPPLQTARRESTRATDRTDALWAEMQATLEEVELSASGGTRVFGPDHDRKLAELRAAQIALAQAWARSEADDAIETTGPETGGAEPKLDETTDGNTHRSGLGADQLGRRLEEEAEMDIKFARRRREANDRYFQRVNQGVLDVVAKLDDVATAMRRVEQESKDVWGDDSVPSSARPA